LSTLLEAGKGVIFTVIYDLADDRKGLLNRQKRTSLSYNEVQRPRFGARCRSQSNKWR